MKNVEKTESRPIRSNLLLSDCFLRDVLPPKDIRRGNHEHKYSELVREVKPEGVIETMREVPYPHTVESVKSYAEAADYRNDPAAAMYQASKNPRKNLGDIRESQNLLRMDSQSARALYEALQKVFSEAAEKKVDPSDVPSDKGVSNPPAPADKGE